MAEKIPRRLKRFRRKGELPEDMEGIELDERAYSKIKPEGKQKIGKEVTMQIALDEVERFKQQHKRLPKKEEYDKIAESIYAQLRDEEKRKKLMQRVERRKPREEKTKLRGRRKRRHLPGGVAGKEEKKETAFDELQKAAKGLSEEEIKGMSVEDLFGKGEEARQKKEAKPSEEEFSLEELSSLEGKEEEAEQNKCPKCASVTEEIIFCPQCGTAFCENCAKKVETLGKVKTIVCPGCGNKIKK